MIFYGSGTLRSFTNKYTILGGGGKANSGKNAIQFEATAIINNLSDSSTSNITLTVTNN